MPGLLGLLSLPTVRRCGVVGKTRGLRACQKIAELSVELPKAQGTRTELRDSSDVKLKTKAVEDAGLNVRTTQRYEGLIGAGFEEVRPASSSGRSSVRRRTVDRRKTGPPPSVANLLPGGPGGSHQSVPAKAGTLRQSEAAALLCRRPPPMPDHPLHRDSAF